MKKFLIKYKYAIILNLMIFASYIIIASVVEIFGIDDITANTYNSNLGLIGSIKHIFYRAYYWNARIGEVLYFIVGCAPRWVYFLLNGLMVTLFFNLVFIILFGLKSKEYFNTKNYYITLLSNYILSLTLFPAYSEVFIWMAGAFNHLWDITILLIAAIPFRLLIDNYNLFEKRKKFIIPYYILCFISGFSVENAVPWFICYMFLINLIKFIKKEEKKEYIIASLITPFSFLIMIFCNSTKARIDFFNNQAWIGNSFKKMIIRIITEYKYLFVYFTIITIIYLIIIVLKNQKKEIKNLFFAIGQLILSTISLLVLFFSPYFAIRETTLFFFFLLTYNTYLLSYILKNQKVQIQVILIEIILTLSLTVRYNFFYKDFNYYNSLRKEYIITTYENYKDYYTQFNALPCAYYDNKYNFLLVNRLTSFENLYCDVTYLKYLLNIESDDDKSYNILVPNNVNILR